MCRRSTLHFFDNWMWTYDPRVVAESTKRPAHMPFDLFERQRELVQFLEARLAAREDGLIEKSREIGFTWVCGGLALHRWLFVEGFKTTFGSRKEEYVDRIGDPDSIFEKIRQALRALPRWMWPRGFREAEHDNYLRLLNPDNGNVIRGEGGDQMGRGGRSTLYIVDEFAFVERAERVEASTSANSDVRIFGSTVNGTGNLFYRKRFGSLRPEQIFRFHYSDDPRKDAEWVTRKRASISEAHIWASEYEIDYTASVEGICIDGKWVESAKRIGKLIRIEPAAQGVAGLDVGAGKARSVLIVRFGPIVLTPLAWGDPDTIDTAHRALDGAALAEAKRNDGMIARVRRLHYDSVGPGHGVISVIERTKKPGLSTVATNMGDEPTDTMWKSGETSKERFLNLKAEAWWLMRERFKSTHEMLLYLTNQQGGQKHPLDELIVLPDDNNGVHATTLAAQLSLPKWFKTEKGKIVLESKQQLATRGVSSPDYAEALSLTFTERRFGQMRISAKVLENI